MKMMKRAALRRIQPFCTHGRFGASELCSAQTLRSRHLSTESSNTCALPLVARGLIRLMKAPIKTFSMQKDGKHINRRVWNLLDLNVKASNGPGVASLDVFINRQKGVWARLYIPHFAAAGRLLPVIFHFHGGGFAILRASSAFYDRYCKHLSKEGRVVISVDYRRSPEHPYPAAYEDCFSALVWLQKQVMEDNPKATLVDPHTPNHNHIETLVSPHIPNHTMHTVYGTVSTYDTASTVKRRDANSKFDYIHHADKLDYIHLADICDLSRCFLMGDSAGGNIVHHVASMAVAAGSNLSPLRIVGCLLLFPFFGGEGRTASELRLANHFMLDLSSCDLQWKSFLPENSNRDHPACNVPKTLFASMGAGSGTHPIRDFTAPWLVVVAEHDPLKDRQLEYVDALQQYNKLVQLHYFENGFHCFHLFGRICSTLTAELRAHVESFIRVHSV